MYKFVSAVNGKGSHFHMKTRINLKIVVPLFLVIVIGISSLNFVVIRLFRKQYEALSANYIDALTTDYSDRIGHVFGNTLNTAKSLSLSIENTVRKNGGRQDALDMVIATLESNPELVGIGVGFEPNAFDGRDRENIGQDHSDDTGRFVPYTFVENGIIKHVILEGYNDEGEDSSWYTVPKATRKTYVTDPYWYNVGDEQHLIFTCVSPVLDSDGNFLAMVGFDIPVSTLANIVQDAELFETGSLMLVSPNGLIAYHPDTSLEGQHFTDYLDSNGIAALNRAVERGMNSDAHLESAYGFSKLTGEAVQYTVVPIHVGESGAPWTVISIVPQTEIGQVIRNTAVVAIIVGGCAGVIILIVITLMVHSIVLRPIKKAKKATDQMTEGSLDIRIGVKTEDELGLLMRNIEETGQKLRAYIDNISETLSHVATGNLNLQIDLDYIGDFMPIKSSMLQILSNLNDTMSSVLVAAHQVMTGSHQVAGGAQSLSRSSMEQAASVEQLASIVDNLSEQIHHTAENARYADEKSMLVQRETETSNAKMQDMLVAMNEIKSSSDQISKIIHTIEDIAFQTNILALNASVEAARAGVSGKGFAVVANEVRNLAKKSSEAAKESALLIEKSIIAVEHGSSVVDEAVQSMSSVSAGVGEVTNNIQVISNASDVQAEAARQITQTVHSISEAVQANSVNAQQSAAISEELSSQSQILNDTVNRFKLIDKSKNAVIVGKTEDKPRMISYTPDTQFEWNQRKY